MNMTNNWTVHVMLCAFPWPAQCVLQTYMEFILRQTGNLDFKTKISHKVMIYPCPKHGIEIKFVILDLTLT